MHISKERASSSFIFKAKIFFCGLIALTATSVANATNVTLSWNPSSSAAASGYNLYYGETSGKYTNKVDIGDETTHTLKELQAGKKYYFAATAYCNCDRFQESSFSAELAVVIPAANSTHTSDVISQDGWSVSVDSEETVGEDGRGINAIDGNPGTIWHTEWKDRRPTHPHEIRIDLGGIYKIDGFRYLPRQDGNANGRIKDYKFYVSSDGSTWGSPVASGTFPDSAAEQEVILSAPVRGRFIRLKAVNEVNGNPWTSVAELKVMGDLAPPQVASSVISQNGWKVSVDSEETVGSDGRGENAIDGDPSTIWHTEWLRNDKPPAHEIRIDLGGIYKIDGFRYLPRQDGNANGRIKDYKFYVSSDGSTWGSPVASGTFPDSAAEQEVILSAPVRGRFIRLKAVNEVNGNPWTSVAELKVMGRPSSGSLLPQEGAFKSAGYLDGKNNPDTTLPPPMEIGEVLVNHGWTSVTFQQSFADPVVVAPSLSYAGTNPGVVRIRNITNDGFDVRLQQWDYLDGPHTKEKIHFIVMERGRYTLPNGARIEAGTIETDSTASFETIHFQQSFNVSPIVLTSITSDNGSHAVTVRKKDISTEGFSLLLQEQEANDPIHGLETVDYIAAEPSLGMAGTTPFEISRTEGVMNHDLQVIPFLNSYTNAPIVISDLQTSNGMDTVSLRWDDLTPSSIKVKVEEEKSMDDETRHTDETVGYIVFGLNK